MLQARWKQSSGNFILWELKNHYNYFLYIDFLYQAHKDDTRIFELYFDNKQAFLSSCAYFEMALATQLSLKPLQTNSFQILISQI